MSPSDQGRAKASLVGGANTLGGANTDCSCTADEARVVSGTMAPLLVVIIAMLDMVYRSVMYINVTKYY